MDVKNGFLALGLVLVASGAPGCDDGQENRAPNAFELIAVADAAQDVDLLPTFSWTEAIDPDEDPVTYSFYLGASDAERSLVASDLVATSFAPTDFLSRDATYSWNVVATDSEGNATQSSVYSFSTRGLRFPEAPATEEAGFSKRGTHTSVAFGGKLWVIGGFGGVFGKDVWSSDDGGVWTAVTEDAAFPGRADHTSVVFNDKLWVLGGRISAADGGVLVNDVWSSEDGENWVVANDAAGFSPRRNHTSVVFDNKIWVIGGFDSEGNRLNDVWSSTDGVTWSSTTIEAPFPERFIHTSVVYRDKIWVIGGKGADGDLNDVWSSADGSTWELVIADAPFSARQGHTAVVFEDAIWILGGYNGSFLNDIWSSDDGSTWVEVEPMAAFSGRQRHSTVVHDNRLWILAGLDDANGYRNDVWVID